MHPKETRFTSFYSYHMCNVTQSAFINTVNAVLGEKYIVYTVNVIVLQIHWWVLHLLLSRINESLGGGHSPFVPV